MDTLPECVFIRLSGDHKRADLLVYGFLATWIRKSKPLTDPDMEQIWEIIRVLEQRARAGSIGRREIINVWPSGAKRPSNAGELVVEDVQQRLSETHWWTYLSIFSDGSCQFEFNRDLEIGGS